MSIASEIAKMAASGGQSAKYRATVLRTDNDGTTWVSIPGGADETMLHGELVDCQPGDEVEVVIENDRATATGNASNPAAGIKTVRAVEVKADTAAEDASKAVVSSATAEQIAREAQATAEATDQHFWADTGGIHVTEVTQAAWNDSGGGSYQSGHNILINSLGLLLRTALNNLVSITQSAIAFFDGQGNAASNIVARFGSSGAQIGKSNAAHSVIDADGQRFYGGSDGTTQLANIGYGEGAAESGTAYAPYYTFGTRDANAGIGNYSVAEGIGAEASGFASHAEGYSHASEDYSHAEGSGTHASGYASHSEGGGTYATTMFDHAEGWGSTASGGVAHAEGLDVEASGHASHAQNRGTLASSDNQTALGKYNVEDDQDTYALIIGNGTADDARSNALAVTWDGDVDLGNDGGESRGITSPADLFLTANRDAATQYRMRLTTAGNLRCDKSTDSGATWTTDSYWQKTTNALETASGADVITINSTNATLVSANYTRWGRIAQVNIGIKLKSAVSGGTTGNIGNVALGTLASGKRPVSNSNLTIHDYGGCVIALTTGALTLANIAPGVSISTSTELAIRGTYILAD